MGKKKWIVLAILLGVCLTGCWLKWERFRWSNEPEPIEPEAPETVEE